MMNAMPKQDTNTLWAEAADTATDVDNLIIRSGESENSYQKIYGNKKSVSHPEEVIVADRTKIKVKLRDRGKKCLWLGQVVQSQDMKYHAQ